MNFSNDLKPLEIVGHGVFSLAEDFMATPVYVSIDEDNILKLSEEILKVGKKEFKPPEVKNPYKAVITELVGSSINYCYWYGKYNTKPGVSSSTYLWSLIDEAFSDYENDNNIKFKNCLSKLIMMLALGRFPLLEERVKHLTNLISFGEKFANEILTNYDKRSLNQLTRVLVGTFPGFASDMFLKRTFLFFIQLYRRFGWFKDELSDYPVPADYQIPKVLSHYKCINYNKQLKTMINSNTLIPKHSQMECEIRSATILSMRKLCELTKWNVADLDSWLFVNRDDYKGPFHLTITTDY